MKRCLQNIHNSISAIVVLSLHFYTRLKQGFSLPYIDYGFFSASAPALSPKIPTVKFGTAVTSTTSTHPYYAISP